MLKRPPIVAERAEESEIDLNIGERRNVATIIVNFLLKLGEFINVSLQRGFRLSVQQMKCTFSLSTPNVRHNTIFICKTCPDLMSRLQLIDFSKLCWM